MTSSSNCPDGTFAVVHDVDALAVSRAVGDTPPVGLYPGTTRTQVLRRRSAVWWRWEMTFAQARVGAPARIRTSDHRTRRITRSVYNALTSSFATKITPIGPVASTCRRLFAPRPAPRGSFRAICPTVGAARPSQGNRCREGASGPKVEGLEKRGREGDYHPSPSSQIWIHAYDEMTMQGEATSSPAALWPKSGSPVSAAQETVIRRASAGPTGGGPAEGPGLRRLGTRRSRRHDRHGFAGRAARS
ncbi:hypothetical protein SAMN05421678_12815 [Actinopolymorpha cephalotaxi]|uniref:Uncharacterized protein n=1 Tax=Actinopolymorpha cephalotaxi TaxID=504797 RepID=A0A1I3C0Q8_9ACTN|nr:hypothetical protein [Actinopolymorpha cephalotaxi]SFH68033.1 hypothetical protein SAMN05421678_12815 [Actinopolymorpha cephalotaxi]